MPRSHALERARRRRFRARRLAVVLVLVIIILLLVFLYGRPSEPEQVQTVSPVEVRAMPEPPQASAEYMTNVWDAAADEDSSPDLATNGKTGTSGDGIALTFDDGPNPQTTPRILDTLQKQDVKATFFVLGSQVKEHPALLRRIVDEGHTIGNHSYDHANMSQLSPGQVRRELQSTQKAVDEALGYHYEMKIMRPPYGAPYDGSGTLPAFRRIVRQEQLFPVIWTIDTQDYLKAGNPQGIVQSVVRHDAKGRNGDRDQIVLMHDIHPQDVQALPGIIDHLKDQGRKFVSVNDLLADKYMNP